MKKTNCWVKLIHVFCLHSHSSRNKHWDAGRVLFYLILKHKNYGIAFLKRICLVHVHVPAVSRALTTYKVVLWLFFPDLDVS